MPRYTVAIESPAALAANSAFAAVVPAAATAAKICRVILGVVAGTAPPTSQQIEVGINRGTARGTASATSTGNKLDPNSPASAITGVDTAWSVAPTLAATDTIKVAFNSQAGADLPWERKGKLEGFLTGVGTANPIVFVNRANALPADHKLVITIEWDE